MLTFVVHLSLIVVWIASVAYGVTWVIERLPVDDFWSLYVSQMVIAWLLLDLLRLGQENTGLQAELRAVRESNKLGELNWELLAMKARVAGLDVCAGRRELGRQSRSAHL
jgi:hypothetical protein